MAAYTEHCLQPGYQDYQDCQVEPVWASGFNVTVGNNRYLLRGTGNKLWPTQSNRLFYRPLSGGSV
ncbi:hypothetical protein SAMN05216593_106137 [Pseudomonas asturiensis]|uniref:Uncharacterized protein n=1 Tax=Pseudomonas asturiensis TaxID=1190415 RepID=A0A1M7NLD7_9PSED|nr:hypothetical protein SAMN05216593_106137 [Pseudomonas asturiensis]